MKLNIPVDISLKTFFKTGKFDCLKLGKTKSWVLNNFPDPDSGFDKEMLSQGFDIWTYGSIELHFEKEILFLIYTDDFENLNASLALNVDEWIFNDLDNFKLITVLKHLNDLNIDYKKLTDKLGVVIRLNSGIELTFEDKTEDYEMCSTNTFKLTSFGLVAENPIRWKNA